MYGEEQSLLTDLLCCSTLAEYLSRNSAKLVKPDLKHYIEMLMNDRHLSRSEVIQGAQIEKVYGYQIIAGKRHPSRDKLIQMCFGLRLGIHQAQELLLIGSAMPLSPRIVRDAIILFALAKNSDILYADMLLTEWQQKPLQTK